ncbi:MAG: hypothetical protein ABGZ17_08355, partial [Planctomycetaceae bacterium]
MNLATTEPGVIFPSADFGVAAGGLVLCLCAWWGRRQSNVGRFQSKPARLADQATPVSARIVTSLAPLFCVIVLGGYAWMVIGHPGPVVNNHAQAIQKTLLLCGLLFSITCPDENRAGDRRTASLGFLLMSLGGALLLVDAEDLMVLALAQEMCWIPLVFLFVNGRCFKDAGSGRLRFVLSGMLSTACTLFAVSLVYMLTAVTRFERVVEVFTHLSAGGPDRLPLGIVLMTVCLWVAGVGIRIGLAPFHLGDTRLSSPHLVWSTGWATVVSLFILVVVGVRLLEFQPVEVGRITETLLFVLALVCLTVGNLRLLSEQRLSIVLTQFAAIQFGILLCGLAIMAWVTTQPSRAAWEIQQRFDNIGVVLSALATAAFSLTGMMAILVHLRGRNAGDVRNATAVHVAELSGLAYRRPV